MPNLRLSGGPLRSRSLASLHLVVVIWSDACFSNLNDMTREAAIRDLHKPTIYRSWGLLVHEDEEGILLASDECVTDPGYRQFSRIPRPMVVEMIDLGVPVRPKPSRAGAGSRRGKSPVPAEPAGPRPPESE